MKYARPFNKRTAEARARLQEQWEESAEKNNVCDYHGHLEPCLMCEDEYAADERRAMLKDER